MERRAHEQGNGLHTETGLSLSSWFVVELLAKCAAANLHFVAVD
jgi:hypothetical protein